jgi:hypothetical protein
MISTTTLLKRWGAMALAFGLSCLGPAAMASSHREAPLIALDPQTDNTDLYVFRSPDDTNTVTIIANYIPFQLPEGGPNYYTFGSNVRYEIHIKNNTATTADDITYRFTFAIVNEDPSTFFNIRNAGAGVKRNQRCNYTVGKATGGSGFFTTICTGTCAPPNIGPRSINSALGMNVTTYDTLIKRAMDTATSGEVVYAGPADDPFFVDLAGAFDLGGFRPSGNTTNPPKDGLARYNVSTIAIKIPISVLQKNGKSVNQAKNILDDEFVIGVWASASRRQDRTLNTNGTVTYGSSMNDYVQVSRLGMPLTNEVIIPIGSKDKWNAVTAYDAINSQFVPYYQNPELALYMDGRQLQGAVPALNALRLQKASRPDLIPGGFDFGNGRKGLWPLKGSPLLIGTAMDPALYGNLLIPDSTSPRAADIMPIFLTGVPNAAPYQLATGKANVSGTTNMNPFAPGKPIINNFLPAVGDMLRLNMAVPVTKRSDPAFSSLGLIQACVLGLTTPPYNTNSNMQFIPNMDGFPNGRRLEDDVTTIEMQAVGGIALAAFGMWYDDWGTGPASPVTPNLIANISFTAGPTHNDTTFKSYFPYVASPWRGYDYPAQARF